MPLIRAAALLLFLPAALAADDLVPVGVARVEITPTHPVRLSGYGSRRTESEGVAQPIWAKALAFGEKDDSAVIITVDNLGVPEVISGEIARRIRLPRERLAVCSSHAHTAPMLTNVAPTLFGTAIPPEHQQNIDRYTRTLTDNLEKVAAAALADRRPGRLAWARGKVGFAANRRTKGGPVDHDLPVLRVTDTDGKLRAVFVNYACHCTTLDGNFNKVHGDWAGSAQELLERANPGATALIAIGCGADANPSPRTGLKFCEQHGESIAREVARLLQGDWKPLPSKVDARFEVIKLDFDKLPTRAEWEARVKQGGAVGFHAQVQLRKLDAGQKLPTTLSYPIQTWAFGDKLAMVFLAGEVVVDYALRLKKEYDPERIWVNAYSNDDPCYIPSLRILREGGYEGGGAMIYYDRPTRFAANVEESIVSELRRQIPAGFKAARDPREFPPPKEPRDALASIKLRPGLRAELAAAEPLVQSPVAIDWGADGRLWVVEMYDYPLGLDGNFKPGGRVKYLEDTDGDGVYDKATTLADDLPFPTGVMAWHNGVLVCAAPDILYLEDTKRDGYCDVRKVILSGFDVSNYQARINGLSPGLDGWVYAANGLLGGKVVSRVGPARVVNIGGRDLRFKPDTGEIEPASGLTQQGRVRDDWGNWFGNDNSHLLRHFPLPDHYLRRNPHFVAPPAYVDVPGGDADPNRLFPASHLLKRFNDYGMAGRTTSACGPCIYRDILLGSEFTGNSFTCEPVHNLVTRRLLTPKGSTFIGRRAADEQTSEFFASTDNWCRPVQVRTGPDGALWVVDMYRFVVEHPRWIPPERLAELDVRAGADRGRIYRIVPQANPPRKPPRLDRLSTAELVGQLDGPNGVLRDLVQQLLVERRDSAALEPLRRLAHAGGPLGRLHALCTLALLDRLEISQLQAALADRDPGVRRQAVRLSEPFLGHSRELDAALLDRASDDDLGVRFQAACSLGFCQADQAGAALARIALRDRNDAYVVAAVLSSMNRGNVRGLVQAFLPRDGSAPPAPQLLERVIEVVPAVLERSQLPDFLALLVGSGQREPQSWQVAAAAALLDAAERRAIPLTESAEVAVILGRLAAAARRRAGDAQAGESERIAALRLLGRDPMVVRDDIRTLGQLISPQQPLRLQTAAIERLALIRHEAVPAALLANWRGHSPDIQARVVDVLLSRDAWMGGLLDAIERGTVRPADINASRRQRIIASKDERIRQRAARVLQTALDGDRRKVVESYAGVAAFTGNSRRGAEVFAKTCAACHRVGEVGHATGPDLAAVTDRTTEALLTAILDPNRALDARYANFTVLTRTGQQFSGMLRSETAASITLVGPDSKKQEVLRSEIDELTNTGKSLMPEGLEKDIPPQSMADLISYLQSIGRPPKKVAGNRPAPIRGAPGEVLHLRAADCEIYGNEITFESEFGNLGIWHEENDHAAWTVEVPRAGRYQVEVRYACDRGSAGNTLVLQAGDAQVSMRVVGTGGWADYVDRAMGVLELGAGSRRLVARPGGPVRGALIDLKEVRLVPLGR